MKKHYYLFAILALVAFLPVTIHAEEADDDAEDMSPAQSGETRPLPFPPQRPGQVIPTLIREQIRNKSENAQNNAELRNRNLENRMISTSTRPGFPNGVRPATSTRPELREQREQQREQIEERRREMRIDAFKHRKENIVRQLNQAVENLKQIRERIVSRIEKAADSGRDMTEAKKALTIADTKIQAAIAAIEAIKSYTPPAPNSASSTDQVVDLERPRQIGEEAQKAVKDARGALVEVVRAIAHAMGLGGNGTSTPPTSQ